jgi:acyl phosphate:glycerol-3-phosphate acyltransferase
MGGWSVSPALCLLGYLCGSVPFGLLLTRYFAREDVRAHGSGNIGATNVARVAGKKVGVLVLVLDALKAAVPVWLAMRVSPEPLVHAAVGLAAFLGHVFPVWLRFKGGKGVASALGVLGVLAPIAALLGAAAYALIFFAFRVSSVGSLLGGITATVVAFATDTPRPYAVLVAVLLVLMLWTHRANIRRLLARTETRIR